MSAAPYGQKERYLRKITSQHRVRKNFMQVVAVLLEVMQDTYDLANNFDAHFDPDLGTGVLLDVLGEDVGAKRVLTFNPVYADSKLQDEDFRRYIKARITMNQWDGSLEGIFALWRDFFEGYDIKVLDRQNMAITVQIWGAQDMFECELISRGYFAPKPEGVRVDYEFWEESEAVGDWTVGGGVVAEIIKERLADAPASLELAASGAMYMGGLVLAEVITERLPEGENIPAEIYGSTITGGGIAHENTIEYLKGGDE